MSGALESDWNTVSLGAALQNNGSTAYSGGKLNEVAFFNRLATHAERDALLAGATVQGGS